MSWDVLLIDVPEEIRAVAEIPRDFDSALGPRADVLTRLRALLPGIDLTDESWGILDGPGFSIEFSIGPKDPVDCIMLHVRGGDGALDPIRHLCQSTAWRALDASDSEFIDFAGDCGRGLRQWRDFRDQVISYCKGQGREVVVEPSLRGVRVDAIVSAGPKPKRWWLFWRSHGPA